MSAERSQSDPGTTDSGQRAGSSVASHNEGELKYQRLVEGISGDYLIYTHDPQGVLTYVSPSISNVLGYEPDAVLGLNWRDLIGEHFIGRELADRVFDEVAEGKDFYQFTVEISHADGTTRLIEIQQRPIFDADNNYSSMEGIAKDITSLTRDAEELKRLKTELEQRVAERTTELIRANQELSKSEARYRTVVNCQTEFIVRWMPGAVLTFANEAYCRLVGKNNDAITGWCFLDSLHADDRAAFEAAIDKLNRDNPLEDFENRVVQADGSVRWTHWTNQILFDEDGEFLEYQSVGRDVSALKEAADTIREKEIHLAHMSRLATMGELVAGIAHEIHQPLHAAKTFSEAARRNLELGTSENIDTAIDCTKEISNAISRTATIIRKLRSFTNARADIFEHLDINQIALGASELVAFETRKAKVRLELNLQAADSTVQGDRVQLEQICVNLIMNACDAMSEVEYADRVLVVTSESDSEFVRLSFCDVGCGVQDDDLPKLFDTFYTTKKKGLGMGLPLCKSIADLHGGSIRFRANEGPGMTFVLELPTMKRPAKTPEPTQSVGAGPSVNTEEA